MSFPRKLDRVTNHKKPRYQLYQPGFNDTNSCWLSGSWITLPKDEWEKKKAQHKKLYGNLNKKAKKQHHRNAGTKPENMTPAQRQAFEHYSGSGMLECMITAYDGSRVLQPVSVDLQGKNIAPKSVKWLREEGYQVLKKVSLCGKVTNQEELYNNIPEDLLSDEAGDNGEPIDWQSKVVEQNMKRFEAQFFESLKFAIDENEPENMRGFAAMTMMGTLMLQEETIIRAEHNAQRGKPDEYTDLPKERERYARYRAELEKIDNWRERYDESKKSHNECARFNLDNSNGHSYSFVLPEFNSDGSHDAWGDKDVPWGNEE
jgi:hypothetical protein